MKEKRAKKYDTLKAMTLVMLFVSLIFLVSGISYAVYRNFLKGTTNNIIEAGKIYFSYDEDTSEFNGVDIKNAYPVSDEVGKVQSGEHEYFDFSVNATTTLADIPFQVFAEKSADSTLKNEWVKLYLTLRNGASEVASPLVMDEERVLTFAELSGDDTSKLIYSGIVLNHSMSFHQDFRLRLWISDTTDVDDEDFYSKMFSVRVRITANESA